MDSKMFRKMTKWAILEALIIIIIPGLFSLPGFCLDKGGEVMPNEKEKISTSVVKNLSITVVYDNNPYNEGLETEWGFSCIIKGLKETILFDTGGDGKILIENMRKLGIDPEEIDLIMISHIHGDHTGGLMGFLEHNSNVVVYLPRSFPESFKEDVKKYNIRVIDVKESLEITNNTYSTGELGILIREQSLILQTKKRIGSNHWMCSSWYYKNSE